MARSDDVMVSTNDHVEGLIAHRDIPYLARAMSLAGRADPSVAMPAIR
jgi:hypothetical protein